MSNGDKLAALRFIDAIDHATACSVLDTPTEAAVNPKSEGLPDRGEINQASLGVGVDDLTSALSAATAVAAEADRSSATGRAAIDRDALEAIHAPLSGLSKHHAGDRGFWTWLATGYGRDFVWLRWTGVKAVPSTKSEIEALVLAPKSELGRRFNARSGSLADISRHAIARLWWLGDAVDGDYELAGKILLSQDKFQAIFERQLGCMPGFAGAVVEVFELGTSSAPSDNDFRAKMKQTYQLASTTRFEALSKDELIDVLSAVRDES